MDKRGFDAERRLSELVKAAVDNYPNDPLPLHRDWHCDWDRIARCRTRQRRLHTVRRIACVIVIALLASVLSISVIRPEPIDADRAKLKSIYDNPQPDVDGDLTVSNGFLRVTPNGVRPEGEEPGATYQTMDTLDPDTLARICPGISIPATPGRYEFVSVTVATLESGKWVAEFVYSNGEDESSIVKEGRTDYYNGTIK